MVWLCGLNRTSQNWTLESPNTHSRMKKSVATRFTIDGAYVERQAATKILGVWVNEDPSNWERNTQEIKKRTYASMSILTKLKYAGLSRRKLLHIFTNSVSKSPCPSVCLCAPSGNTNFRRSCRPLVEDCVPNVGLRWHYVQKKGGIFFFFWDC